MNETIFVGYKVNIGDTLLCIEKCNLFSTAPEICSLTINAGDVLLVVDKGALDALGHVIYFLHPVHGIIHDVTVNDVVDNFYWVNHFKRLVENE